MFFFILKKRLIFTPKELRRNCSPIGHNNTKHFLCPIRSQHPLDCLEMVRWESVPRGRDPFNQNFRKFRSKTQWIGSVQPEKFRKNRSTLWGGPLFPVGPVWILVDWIAPRGSSACASKLSSRLFARRDWLPLGLQGWGVCGPGEIVAGIPKPAGYDYEAAIIQF